MTRFDVPKIHKWADNIENILTEWAMDTVQEHYGVDDTDNLTEEQWQEIRDWVDNMYDAPLNTALGFNNILNAWESANYDDD